MAEERGSLFYNDIVHIFGNGFSVVNIKNPISSDDQKSYTLCSQLNGSHNKLLNRKFDDLKRGDNDNPTIGIIFCTDKDETVVKYSVLQENRHLFASKYRTVLPTEQELREELDREKWIVSERLAMYKARTAEQTSE